MPKNSQFKLRNSGKSCILYDGSILADPSVALFDSEQDDAGSHRDDVSLVQSAGIGRAKVVYFSHNDVNLVLKHYYRGGLVASINKDRYLGLDVEKTRAFREFRLLEKMKTLGLPVPDVVAAHAEKGLFYFRADLITREIENVNTLADYLSDKSADALLWNKVGACIKEFHAHNVDHADLNARNILLTNKDEVYLIDFDNSNIRNGSDAWKQDNLLRLKRSLLKFKNNTADFRFDENDWIAFLKGYDS